MIMASLTVKNLVKKFGKVPALNGVDLHVEDGEFCVLLGPSGCGKSTLLNIVAGLIPQDEGAIALDGKNVDRLFPRERDVAMVFQNYALYPHMTVAQNLGFGLKMRKVSKATIQTGVVETARLLGIEGLLDRKPRELSGGQRQRVAMGRALVRRPKLFLLDEPLSNLDARLRTEVRLELKQLHQQISGTIVYVTHDQVEAMTLGDKVVVMRDGLIHQIGDPDAIYECPANVFVAKFIGSPEMNIFSGRLKRQKGHLGFQGPGFTLDLIGCNLDLDDNDIDDIDVGMRPEDLVIGDENPVKLSAQAKMLSNVGSEKYIYAQIGRTTITVRAPKETSIDPDQMLSFSISPNRLHIFHNGLRIPI